MMQASLHDLGPYFFESMQLVFCVRAHAVLAIDLALLVSLRYDVEHVRVERDPSMHQTMRDCEMAINLLGFLSLRSNRANDIVTRCALAWTTKDRSSRSFMSSI